MTDSEPKDKPVSCDRDQNLLFGVMAVQLQLITAADLARAAAVWAAEPGSELGSVLVGMGLLDDTKRNLIAQLLEVQVAKHGDAEATLRSFGGSRAVLESFGPGAAGAGGSDRTLPSFGGDRWEGGEGAPGMAPVMVIDDTVKVTSEHSGRYVFRGEAGHGAMGQVLVAFDEHVGREVAIKELLPDPVYGSLPSRTPSSGTTPAAQRFLREARITGQLEHPGIVPVHEIGRRGDGTLYYTMKLVRGKTLADRFKEIKEGKVRGPGSEVGREVRGPRSEVRGEERPPTPLSSDLAPRTSDLSFGTSDLSARLKLLPHFLDLCQSMAYAHSKGVVHRDLKPANVMIGEFGETVALDWGLAKVRGIEDVREGDLEENLRLIKEATAGDTVRGKPIGTPAYMSPEQAEGDIGNIDERSDVWSLGAVLFEVLTGRPPFTGSTAYEVMGKVLSDPLPDAAELAPGAPAELVAVAAKCLAKDRGRRYADAGELAADVHNFLAGGLVSAYEYSMAALIGRWLRKRWPVVATAGAAALLLVILGAYSYVEIGKEKDLALAHERTALTEKARAEDREQEARLNLAEAYYQMGLAAEKKKLWCDVRLLYARSLTLNDREPARSGHYFAAIQPATAALAREIAAGDYAVMSAAWSPDGTRILSGSCAEKNSGMCARGAMKLWDAASGDLVRSFEGHGDYVRSVAFSPDGTRAVSGSWDNTVKVWDLASGACLYTISGHNEDVYAAIFSPDGSLIASGGYDGTVQLWDAAGGAGLGLLASHEFGVNSLAFTPDGQGLLTGWGDGRVELWSVERRELVRTYSGHTYIVEAIAVSPDGRLAASAGWDKTVKIWDLASGECLRTLTGHEDRVYTVGFSPDGRWVASGGLDKTVMVWSAASGENALTLGANRDLVQAAVFSPDGGRLLAAGSDHTIKVWSLAFRETVRSWRAADKILWSAAAAPAGGLIGAAASDDAAACRVKLWRADGTPAGELPGQPYPYLTFAFSPDGKKVLTGGCARSEGFDCFEGELKLWDAASAGLLQTLTGHLTGVNAVAYSPDGRTVASGSCGEFDLKKGCAKGEIKIWDLETGKCVRTIAGHDDMAASLAFTPDGKKLVSSGGLDARLMVWDLADGRNLAVMSGHTNLINMIAVSPDGKLAASASFDNTARLWEIQSGQQVRTITGHEVGLKSVNFSRDGKYLLTGGWDHLIKLWDLGTGACVLTIRAHEAPVAAALFTPDGKSIVSAGDDNIIKVWPLDWEMLTARPEGLFGEAERATGLALDGFKLTPLASD